MSLDTQFQKEDDGIVTNTLEKRILTRGESANQKKKKIKIPINVLSALQWSSERQSGSKIHNHGEWERGEKGKIKIFKIQIKQKKRATSKRCTTNNQDCI